MTDHTEEPTRRAMWEYALLRAFEVPDIVTPDHAAHSIAQAVVTGTAGRKANQDNNAIHDARRIVGSIVRLGSIGALDPLVIEDNNASPARDTLLHSPDLVEQPGYAGFLLDTVTAWVRDNPVMPAHLLQFASARQ